MLFAFASGLTSFRPRDHMEPGLLFELSRQSVCNHLKVHARACRGTQCCPSSLGSSLAPHNHDKATAAASLDLQLNMEDVVLQGPSSGRL